MTHPDKDSQRGIMSAALNLLPCPFCGSTNIDPAEWSGNDGKHGPGCGDCGALGESAEAWNRRTAPAVGADGLPALPRHSGMIEVITDTAWNTFADAYTADQMRQYALDAIAADRQAQQYEKGQK
jgi:hypothetical protein